MLWGSIAAEATAALGAMSTGTSGGVNGRGCLALALLRHHRRTSPERLRQHHQRAKRCSGHPNNSAHVYVPKGIESPWDHHSDFASVSPPGFRNIRKFLGTRLLPHSFSICTASCS